jgi:hypothetical protein
MSQTTHREPVAHYARLWFGLTAVIVGFGLVLQLILAARNDSGYFATPLSRAFNLLFFFTVLSNIMVTVASALLYFNPRRLSLAFNVLRLTSVIGIAVTGVVFHGVLSGLQELQGADKLADFILHTLSPIMAVLGWLVFGPRGQITPRIVKLSILFPAIYCAITLIRGPLVGDWYPYPFIDVAQYGYGRVALNCALVAVLFVGLAAGAYWLDSLLTRRAPAMAQLSGR